MNGNIIDVLRDILNTFYERSASSDNNNNNSNIITTTITQRFQNLRDTSKFYTLELRSEASSTLNVYKY
jgi:ABC-type transporter Mla subunit MlaD